MQNSQCRHPNHHFPFLPKTSMTTATPSRPKILAFAGSQRAGSFNKNLVKIAAAAASAAGAEVTFLDLRDLELPLFDQDLEAVSGLPDGAKKFKALLQESDGFLIASPEYNGSFTPVLKNAIDWATRPETKDEPSLVAFRGKTAALMAASPGGLGGMRALVHLRSLLGNIGVLVLPDQITLGTAYDAFTESGELKDEAKAKQVVQFAGSFVNFLRKHAA